MARKIILGKTYITTFGQEFTPIKIEKGPIKQRRFVGNLHADVGGREESRCIDKDGIRIRKSKLSHIKGEVPPKKPKSTI